MKISLELNDQVVRRAKRRAARDGMTLTHFVEDALRTRLAVPRSGQPSFRLRLNTVTGHAPPNVDIVDRDALYAVVCRA